MMADHGNRGRLLFASFLTLIAAGVGFGVRAGILTEWSSKFGFTMFQLGTIAGGGLVGFGFVILAASLITDRVGYKPLLIVALVLHVLSALITLAATPVLLADLARIVFVFVVAVVEPVDQRIRIHSRPLVEPVEIIAWVALDH